jgi:hypothetical protein
LFVELGKIENANDANTTRSCSSYFSLWGMM